MQFYIKLMRMCAWICIGVQFAGTVHADDAVGYGWVTETLHTLPSEYWNGIFTYPEEFADGLKRILELPRDYRQLVDKTYPLAADYRPADLVPLDEYPMLTLNRAGMYARRMIMDDLAALVEAARDEGITLDISSAYRSYEYQAGLFERHVAQLGIAQAERESARAGHSQHQLGTTLDFGSVTPAFGRTRAGRWLRDNAYRFGFSLSYPDGEEQLTGYIAESWHYRHLGRDALLLERRFFGGLQQRMLEYIHVHEPLLRTHLLEAS